LELNKQPLGAILIGHATAELGRGEDLRTSALAFSAVGAPIGIIDYEEGVLHRKEAKLNIPNTPHLSSGNVNIVHLNADQIPHAILNLGLSCFLDKYNILYPAWELSKWPEAWRINLEVFDEIWAPSRFIWNSLREATNVPVFHMPLCVSLEEFPARPRKFFNLPERRFLFLFAFDALSYVARKNPLAAISAFRRAFKTGSESVGLVLKVMNLNFNPKFKSLLYKAAEEDPRIFLLDETLDRSSVLALMNSCDSFISLHRSEGFGRGPAEAMLMGKPIITTSYSGNLDFTRADNSLLVDYRLVPVRPDEYPCYENQFWAEPDIDHAAHQMKRIVEDQSFAEDIAKRGKAFLESNFSPRVCGARFRDRLKQLRLLE